MISVSLISIGIAQKLAKPLVLKGLKQFTSVDYIANKCRCALFRKDNDLYVQHNDYFSESMYIPLCDRGAPLSYLIPKYLMLGKNKKFVYSDDWGSIVIRRRAWIKVEGLFPMLQQGVSMLRILNDLLRSHESLHGFEEYELCATDMERFWEGVIAECIKNL